MFYQQVKTILEKNGWLHSEDAEDQEFIWFTVNGETYAVVKKDQENEMTSLCVIGEMNQFSDDYIPSIFLVAANVNNRHSCARVAIHSHIYDKGFEGNMFGFEFYTPKSCLGDISNALETAVQELKALQEDFYSEMEIVFPHES